MEAELKLNAKEVMARLSRLQADIAYIKEHIEDITLTEDDLKSIEEAERDLREGKTTSHEKLKRELGL